MAAGYVIRKNQYYDSIFLMRVAARISEEPGVQQCAVLMATGVNKDRLAEMGFDSLEVSSAAPNDLVIAISGDNPQIVERLMGEMDERLRNIPGAEIKSSYRTLEDAAASAPQSNLVVISTPGNYAAREAHRALDLGKHVFLFSDNVTIEEEVALKQLAKEKRRLVMGPDCGTSLIGGVGIGFSNHVRRGPIGVVGASGTGIQEFTSLVHQAGSGISHAIGTGTHDLSDAVGGITTLMGLDILEADPDTRVIAVISKPSGANTLLTLEERLHRCSKPVISCMLGLDRRIDSGIHFTQVRTIDEAVENALTAAGYAAHLPQGIGDAIEIEGHVRSWMPKQRYLRGLFAGGTFCYQAQQVLKDGGISVYSNSPLDKRYHLTNPEDSLEHTIVDLGDDYFTQSKPHPMIDARERNRRILQEADDPETAILLLDFVLGEMASMDPAGDLVHAIQKAREKANHRGGCLIVVASICGTDEDPQDMKKQQAILRDAGVILLPTSAQAARFCLDLLQLAGDR